MLLLLIVGNEK